MYKCSTRINVNTCFKNAIRPTVIHENVYEKSMEQAQIIVLKTTEFCAQDLESMNI